jgi:hypothetical protein
MCHGISGKRRTTFAAKRDLTEWDLCAFDSVALAAQNHMVKQ